MAKDEAAVPIGTVLFVTIVGDDCTVLTDDKLSVEALFELKEKVSDHIDEMIKLATPKPKGSLH